VSVTITKAINRIPTARIVILDGDMPNQDFPISNSATLIPGAEITITAGYGQNQSTIFQGILVGQGMKISGDNYARLVIECRDKAVEMTIGRKNANFVDAKDSDVISRLIGNYQGLSSDVEATKTQYKELVQYYCTDWDFLLSRAEVNGMLVTVESGAVTVKSPQTSGTPQLKVTYGEDLMEFHAELDARAQYTAVTGTVWDQKSQGVLQQKAGPKTLNTQGNLDGGRLARVVGPATFRLQTPISMEATALQAWVDGQQMKSALARIRGRMTFQGSAQATIGQLIELHGVGDRFNGEAFVSSVKHDISNGNWITEAEFGLSPEWFAEQRNLVAPPASGFLPGIEGLHIGVVKKLEEDPEGEQRVQVSVPVLEAEMDGVWARLAGFYGSNGIGAFFIPEVGDEVVLGYMNNDPCHPVILGSLYSSKRKPPYSLTADNFTKALVTKSKLKLEFDDDKKVITIMTPGKNTITLSDDDKSILLQDQNSNKVTLSSSGILLDSPKDIAMTAKGKITIEAVGEIDISSKADVKVAGLNINNSANIGFVAKGNASAELSASGQTTVKGAMVMIN
jgi:Rhs element Vgr protein